MIEAAQWDVWLELHVEQPERLEEAGRPVGVVTDITGITHCAVTIICEANHAGATPMDRRIDALAAASEFVLDIESGVNDLVESGNETTVGSVSRVHVSPNATNVVPGKVELGVDIRAIDYSAMNQLVSSAEKCLHRLECNREVETTFDREFDLDPVQLTQRIRSAATRTGETAGIETLSLHSGAARDSMYVATVTDAGMLFARLERRHFAQPP